ncbi:MAG: flavin reductase [Marmoricola sp.]|nr:flavin reductase [Marmoricola sp.]
MTIHDVNPFGDPEPDQWRRLRGRLGGAVTLWTSGEGRSRAGLTVSSVVVAGGEPPRVVGLLDPDSDLSDTLASTGRCVVHLLRWRHRELAEAFAGLFPAPGGPFTLGEWETTASGPRLLSVQTWATGVVDTTQTVGWSDLVVLRLEDVVVGDDDEPLEHRRGRYRRP